MAARPAAKRTRAGQLRLGALCLALLLTWTGLGYRLFEVQVVRADELANRGLGQRMTHRELAPDRGTIFDRTGELLAMTVEAESIYAVPGEVENPLLVAQRIAGLAGRDWETIRDRLLRGGSFAYLARQVEPETAARIADLGLRGVYSLPEPKRVYPTGSVAAHVVGLVDIDGNGVEGLEHSYDEILRGVAGEFRFERDRNGVPIPLGVQELVPATPGSDLVATVDLPLQYSAHDACAAAVERTSARGCWIVVLQPETGEILAMAGAPAFDPAGRIATDGTTAYTNFAVRGMYEPGSTEKLITVATALDTGVFGVGSVIPQVADRYETTGGACDSDDDDIHGCFGDFEPHETRDMTVQEIFTISSNIGTIRIAERLPEGSLTEYMARFGLGAATGVDYSGEAAGVISVDRSCSSCLASAAIGYSVAVTPLQMAAAYAAVANDGMWLRPTLVRSQVDVNGARTSVEPEARRVVSESTAWVMRQLLARVVHEGTGQAAQITGYRVGGKTGTANKLGPDGYTEETMASFVGMAPIDDPKVVVAVVIDDPAFEYRTGGTAAAPAFAAVMEAALHRLGVAPDAIEG